MSHRRRWILWIGAIALLATPIAAHAGSRIDVRTALTRAAGSPDSDAKGEVRVRSDVKKSEHEIDIKAERIDSTLEHRLYIDDGLGTLTLIGTLEPDGSDEVRYRVRTKDGDALPFAETDPANLVGRALEVRQVISAVEQVVLEGTMPALVAGTKGKAKLNLDETSFAPAKSKARLRMRSRTAKGDERFEIKVNKLDFSAGQVYHVRIEDPLNLGTFLDVGEVEPRGKKGNYARFRRRTKDGDPLPLDVATVGDLSGLGVEIFEVGSGDVYFDGVIPALD